MEYCASNLTTGDLPCMVIKNHIDAPEFFSPCDAMKLPATGGCFSYEDDREKVLDVLQTMVHHKASYFDEIGDVHLARLMRCFAPMMTGGIDRAALAAPASHAAETAVDRLKKRMRWRDDATEAAWTAATGWNLMTIAAMVDDVAAVRELCAAEDAITLLSARGKPLKPTQPHHRLPFARMLLNMSAGHVPLMGAMGYASSSVVTIMLRAGCPLPTGKDLLETFCGSPCHRPSGALFNGRTDNCDAFLAVHPHALNLNVPGGADTFWQNLMHIAVGIDRPHIKPNVEWLLERGCQPLMKMKMAMGTTPMHHLFYNLDADLSVLPVFENADTDFVRDNISSISHPMTKFWGVYHSARVFGLINSKSFNMARMFKQFIIVGTPLHLAAVQGNVQAVATLLDMGCDPTIRSKASTKVPGCKRLTAYEIFLYKYPESAAVAAVAKMHEERGFGHVVASAKVSRKRATLAKTKIEQVVEAVKVPGARKAMGMGGKAAKKYQVAPMPVPIDHLTADEITPVEPFEG